MIGTSRTQLAEKCLVNIHCQARSVLSKELICNNTEKHPFLSNIFSLHVETLNTEYEPNKEIKKKIRFFYLLKCDSA
jgi:hypothetical protein